MPWHAIILCEGAHDQAVILSLASRLDGWALESKVPKLLPPALRGNYPTPKEDRWEAPRFERFPKYLRNSDRWIEVRQLGGIPGVLGESARDLLERAKADAVGVIVDANESGVANRVKAFRNRFHNVYAHADKVEPGTICPGNPCLGLWVAPNNKKGGTMSDLMLEAALKVKPKLTQTGSEFVASLENLEPGKWSAHRSKAILGSIGQAARPGASLAVALQEQKWLFETNLEADTSFTPLLKFLDNLVRI